MVPTVRETQLPLRLVHRGKVRDIYDLGDRLLFVATDRLSAFDVVFAEPIPGKGSILTQLSLFWAKTLPAAKPFHAMDVELGDLGGRLSPFASTLRGRTMVVEKLEMEPAECVVRAYLVGSAWKDYVRSGAVCGQVLPAGMKNGQPLPEPLFTPATKAPVGEHDENVSFGQLTERIGSQRAAALRDRSLALFAEAARHAATRGLILVDTKFEFGRRVDGTLVLADEVLTPDSSRFWDVEDHRRTPEGKTPPSYDKQLVRDYLETLAWSKQPPAPPLPASVIDALADRYRSLYRRLVGAEP